LDFDAFKQEVEALGVNNVNGFIIGRSGGNIDEEEEFSVDVEIIGESRAPSQVQQRESFEEDNLMKLKRWERCLAYKIGLIRRNCFLLGVRVWVSQVFFFFLFFLFFFWWIDVVFEFDNIE
jgi:hypothetical protein